MRPSGPENKTVWAVYVGLLALLGVSAVTSRFLSGWMGTSIALLLAVMKLSLIFVYFMRLRYQPSLVRVVAAAGFFWLGLMMIFTFTDYLTRT